MKKIVYFSFIFLATGAYGVDLESTSYVVSAYENGRAAINDEKDFEQISGGYLSQCIYRNNHPDDQKFTQWRSEFIDLSHAPHWYYGEYIAGAITIADSELDIVWWVKNMPTQIKLDGLEKFFDDNADFRRKVWSRHWGRDFNSIQFKELTGIDSSRGFDQVQVDTYFTHKGVHRTLDKFASITGNSQSPFRNGHERYYMYTSLRYSKNGDLLLGGFQLRRKKVGDVLQLSPDLEDSRLGLTYCILQKKIY